MATVADTRLYYDHFDWRYTGEFWARRWGGSDMQWYGTILPRIHRFIPARTILEIGPGQGRLSTYLEPHATDRLVLIDLTRRCVEGCSRRFRDNPKVQCLLGDGQSLGPIADGSVDFVFSFFSLVHADAATLRCYILDIARTLGPQGVAFLHHSNAAECVIGDAARDAALEDERDTSVSANKVANFIADAGLVWRSQELFGWETGSMLTDCFTVFSRSHSRVRTAEMRIYNWEFPAEAAKFGQLARAYGS
jgi:SAM-dependent methyltransferase